MSTTVGVPAESGPADMAGIADFLAAHPDLVRDDTRPEMWTDPETASDPKVAAALGHRQQVFLCGP